MEDYKIYTDGSCRGNGKKGAVGGWAYVILLDDKIIAEDSGAEFNTTNQRMELTAALKACEMMEELNPFANEILYSDSAYLINCKKQGWYRNWQYNGWKNSKKEPVANSDLWLKLIPYFDCEKCKITFEKVKGHVGIEYNEKVDKMAVDAAVSLNDKGR